MNVWMQLPLRECGFDAVSLVRSGKWKIHKGERREEGEKVKQDR